MVPGSIGRTLYASIAVSLFLVFAISGAGISATAAGHDGVGGDGQTYGWCGDFIVLGGLILGDVNCSFTINVAAASLNKHLWWDSEWEPTLSFDWEVDATARSPNPLDPPFTQHWAGFGAIGQEPGLPQRIAQITAARVGTWIFTATFHPSEPAGRDVGSPDTGQWDVKACIGTNDPNDHQCIVNTPGPIPI